TRRRRARPAQCGAVGVRDCNGLSASQLSNRGGPRAARDAAGAGGHARVRKPTRPGRAPRREWRLTIMSIKKILVAAAACSLFSGIAAAQGAFDFRAIPGLPADPNVQVDLGPALLGFVAEAARQSDPGAADMIAGLRSISVRVYEELTG